MCAWSSGCTPSHRKYTDSERLPDAAFRGKGKQETIIFDVNLFEKRLEVRNG